MKGMPKHLNVPQDLINMYEIDRDFALSYIASLEAVTEQEIPIQEAIEYVAPVEYQAAVYETNEETGEKIKISDEIEAVEEILAQEAIVKKVEIRHPQYYEFRDVIEEIKKRSGFSEYN